MAHHSEHTGVSQQPGDNRGSGPGRGPGTPSIGEAITGLREELLRAEVLASQLENASDYTTILQTLATDINTLAAITPVRKTAPTPIGI